MAAWFFGLHVFAHWAAIVVGVGGAIAAFIYAPGRLGGLLAAAGLSVAVCSFSLDAGYRSASRLCQEADLRQQIAARDAIIAARAKEAQASSAIAGFAAARAAAADRAASLLQKEVDDYADQLSRRSKNARCYLSWSDVRGLQSIGSAGPAASESSARSPAFR